LLIKLLHWGNPLDAGAREMLEKSLRESLEGNISLETVALTPQPITRQDGDLRFVAHVATTLRAVRSTPEVGVCLTRPDVGESKTTLSPADKELALALDALLRTQPGLTTISGKQYELRLTRGACSGTAAPPASAADSAAAGGAGHAE
jgi:hypothetical protein